MAQQKREKNENAKGYNQDLNQQEWAKRQKEREDKNLDKMYAQLEVAQQNKTEQSRKYFFDKM